MSAPLLRQHDVDGRDGGHSTDEPLPTFITEIESTPHDINVLPHMYSAKEIERLFPTIEAAPGAINDEDFDAERDHGARKRGSARVPSFKRPPGSLIALCVFSLS